MSFKNLGGQTARWIQRLQEYKFISEHRQGRKRNADALSRRPCQEVCTYCHKVEARADIKQVQAIALRAGRGGGREFESRCGQKIFTSPYRPDRLWGPPNLL
jgi:hypothetical protein